MVIGKPTTSCFSAQLTSEKLLIHYDPSKELLLSCNALPYGVGAVLSHRTQTGTDQPIAFASRSLSKAEKKYAHLDKEGIAIVYGVKKFHQYLYDHKIHYNIRSQATRVHIFKYASNLKASFSVYSTLGTNFKCI